MYVFSKALCEPKAMEAGPGYAHSALFASLNKCRVHKYYHCFVEGFFLHHTMRSYEEAINVLVLCLSGIDSVNVV